MTSVDTTRILEKDHSNDGVVWFPLMWDLTRRKVVVVGGGATAEDKINLLVEAGADVTVITPAVTETIDAFIDQGRVEWLPRDFASGDLTGARLAIAATDDEEANSAVYREAETIGIPINAVDDPARCSVIFPAVHRDGPLVVAISTSGAAPAVAVRLRDRIAKLTEGYGRWLDLLRGFRSQIRGRFATFAQRRDVWYRIADAAPALDAARSGDTDTAGHLVQEVIDRSVGTNGGATPVTVSTKVSIDEAARRAEARIADALQRASLPVVTCSMQLGGLVLLDLVRKQEPDVRVVFVDTGYHFPETLVFRDQVAAEWGLNLTIATADLPLPEQETRFGSLYHSDPARCCAIRKLGPAETVLANHDLWLAAVRRSQGVSRVDLPVSLEHRLSTGKTIHKAHPLIDWSWADVETYANRYGIPRHPLYQKGYSSIGCAPCTTPTFGQGDERSGRWDGTEINECGLHVIRDRDEET